MPKKRTITLSKTVEEFREGFFNLSTPRDVARLLEVDYSDLIYYLYRSHPGTRYFSFDIPKRKGGVRTISAPSNSLKILQRKLNQVLHAVYRVKKSVHGFVGERSILTNAKRHQKKNFVLNLDLNDFFPSINFGRVRGMFMGWPYYRCPEVATTLAKIYCHENILPQGAPTSPTVSNMICAKLDSNLEKLSRLNKCVYSRYADDLRAPLKTSLFYL